jgi:hypothetical protein
LPAQPSLLFPPEDATPSEETVVAEFDRVWGSGVAQRLVYADAVEV